MSMSPQCRPQSTPLAGPGPEAADEQLNDGLVLETLNLHAGAINAALTQLHALQGQFKGLCIKPMSQPNGLQIVEQRLQQVGTQLQVLAEQVRSGGNPAVYMGNGLVLAYVLDCFKMYLDSSDLSMTPHLIVHRHWEWGTTKVLSELLKPGMTVVDIGANVGYYTLIAAAAVGPEGRVHALEPDPHNFEILNKNIYANVFHKRAFAHRCAALNQRQEVLLNKPSCLSGCNSILMPEQKVPVDQAISVEALPLDELIREKVDLIKIDAEGAEPFILEGMHEVIANSPGLKIIMEFNVPMIRKTLDPASFLSRLRELGFTFRVISEQGVLENLDDSRVLQTPISNLLLERSAVLRPKTTDASSERISPKPSSGVAAPKIRPAGVLVRGIVYGGSGYADETLATVLRLAQHLPVELQPIYEQTDRMNLLSQSTRDQLGLLQQTRVNLSQSIALQWIMANGFNLQLPGRKRVGRTMFATDRLPEDWASLCQSMDEIWVPSEFNRRTFSSAGVDEARLRVMTAGVDTKMFRPGLEPVKLAKKRGFAFLSVFEWTDRKAPEVLLRAYFQEFKPEEDVTLILRTYPRRGPNADLPARIAEIAERQAGVPVAKIPSTILMPHFVSAADVPRLYATADAFVLPSRGEGYGRPYLEALACECPVIATGWGGQSDFLNNENSYLIDSKLVTVPPDVDVPLYAGHCWAEPDVDHLQQLMRHVFTHRSEARTKAERGRAQMVAQWDWDVVARRWITELNRLLA